VDPLPDRTYSDVVLALYGSAPDLNRSSPDLFDRIPELFQLFPDLLNGILNLIKVKTVSGIFCMVLRQLLS
jgi:hypothetical protein